jgi:hypothetical protein
MPASESPLFATGGRTPNDSGLCQIAYFTYFHSLRRCPRPPDTVRGLYCRFPIPKSLNPFFSPSRLP